jgi:hypothetical protein
MRVFLALVLLISVQSAGLAQQSGCSVQVRVQAPDLSSLPEGDAQALVEEWNRNIKSMKYRLPDGRWSWSRQSGDFTLALIQLQRLSVRDLMSRPEKLQAGAPPPRSVSDLDGGSFVAWKKKERIQIRSATHERGPRRVVFVAENAKKMPEAARRIEAAVISGILSKARSEDSFALLTARGPRVQLPFGSSRDAVRAAVEDLANPPQGKRKGQGVLDAVLEATTWLQRVQRGDSIFVLALNLESKHHAKFSEVRDTLTARRIRLFGLELGYVTQPDTESLHTASLMGGHLIDTIARGGNVDHLREFAGESGGSFFQENTARGKRYKLTDDRLKFLQGVAQAMYDQVTEFYVLQLDSTGADVRIGLAPSVLAQHPWVSISYPEHLAPCSAAATPAPAGTTETR